MSITDDAVQTRVPRAGALPYLAIKGARTAIEFYQAAFGAEVIGDPYFMADGRIGHAELAVGGGVIYLADEFPDIGVVAPTNGTSVSLMIAVDDTDAATERMRLAGATVQREPFEDYGSRNATVLDPFGHRWMLSGPITSAVPNFEPIRDGDLAYISWWSPDTERAARFYGSALGWSFDTDKGARRQVHGTSLPTGFDGGHERSDLFCCYAVHDIESAVDRVRAADGQAGEVTDEPFGRAAMCVDRQGREFALWQAGADTARPSINGDRPGDVSYVTYAVGASAGFRDFYGAVFGWTFSPGRIEDGWGSVDAAPMSGMHGGSDHPGVIPMWKVADVDAAAERVTAAGGRIIEAPAQQPYGRSAYCVDDQGGRFYLGDA